jgi:type III pantothenate kinase
MILCLDSGNSRIKYGLWADACLAGQRRTGARRLAGAWAVDRPLADADAHHAGQCGWPCRRGQYSPGTGAWAESIEVVRSSAAACGVRSHYQYPERLGVDRWCALIGARSLYAGALLVVMAGTATTIDTLDAEGNFLGGFILPGQHLMLSALARDTAALPFADGQYADLPRNTEDAIVSGAIEAQAGAIERAWQRLPAGERHCLLSGGNAPVLAQHLAMPVVQMENLPLYGLKEMARQT